ncbi:MAG: amidophosphoribosyltransferase [Candidatus Nanoarchaeia archaeon]|nr:amidophosphoribosyltransferase [Candidatus Nanoarchaeia archaeon]
MEHAEYLAELLDKPHEECGVVGVILDNNSASEKLYLGMQGVQHRGELGAGMSVSNGNEINTYKDVGLVTDIFQPKKLEEMIGYSGIGHTRYATTATGRESSKKDAVKKLHPFEGKIKGQNPFGSGRKKLFSVAFNGTITNYTKLRKELKKYGFETDTDTEVIKCLIEEGYDISKDILDSLAYAYMKLEGAYSIVLVDREGNLYAMKDGHGFKPLCIGEISNKEEKGYIFASESRAVDFLDAKLIREIEPGEIVKITKNMEVKSSYMIKKKKSLCFFEYVYFASPDSVIEGVNVNNVRVRLGKNLWKEMPMDIETGEKDKNWRVIPVPDSGRSSASGYAGEGKLKKREGLMRNRYYPKRTFINGNPDERKNAAKSKSQKYNVIKEVVEGKDVILVDDSIVRGNTMHNIINRIKDAGANSVHLKISCPPIRHPCYMGIDFPTHEQLIANNPKVIGEGNPIQIYEKDVDEICSEIGADSLQYISLEGLLNAIKGDVREISDCSLCLACLTGEYPCKIENELLDKVEYVKKE